MSELKIVKNYEINKQGVMVASRPVRAGQLVLLEPPLCKAPGRQCYPLCLSCLNWADGENFCLQCEWPLCSAECNSNNNTMHTKECSLFAKNNFMGQVEDVTERTLAMDFVGALRLILAMEEMEEKEKKMLLSVDTYNEKRKSKFAMKYFIGCEDMLLRTLRNSCKIEGYSDDELLTIIGLFEMYSTPMAGDRGAKAFHYANCFMKSSCSPNSYSVLLSDGTLMVKASVDMAEGQEVTRFYGDAFKCTAFRREEIESNYMFQCRCIRCSDPTELSTYFGALNCPDCCKEEAMVNPTDPFDQVDKNWKCNKCNKSFPGAQQLAHLRFIDKNITEALENSPGSVEVLQFLLKKSGEWDRAPKTGHTMITAKRLLLVTWGNVPGHSYTLMTDEELMEKIGLCQECMSLLDKFCPGFGYERAGILWEAVNAGAEFLKREVTAGVDIAELKDKMVKWCGEILNIVEVGEEEESVNHGMGASVKYILETIYKQ